MSDRHIDTAELDIFVMNLETKEVHHKNSKTGGCNLDQIKEPVVAVSLAQARKEFDCDPCYYCFKSRR